MDRAFQHRILLRIPWIVQVKCLTWFESAQFGNECCFRIVASFHSTGLLHFSVLSAVNIKRRQTWAGCPMSFERRCSGWKEGESGAGGATNTPSERECSVLNSRDRTNRSSPLGGLGTVLHGSSSCDVRQTGSQLTSRHQGSQTEGRFYSHQKCGSSLFPLFGSAPVSHRERTKPFPLLGRPIPLGSHSFGPFPAIYPLSSPLVQPMGQHGEDAPPFRSERRSR